MTHREIISNGTLCTDNDNFLSGCHNELMSVRKKFITTREAVNDMKGNNGQPLMVPLTGSLYVQGKLSDHDKIHCLQSIYRLIS